MSLTLVVLAAVAGAVVLLFLTGLRLVNEYQRGVVFRLGRMSHMKGPGLRLVIPILDRVVKVDLRAVHFEIPTQEVITNDNVLVTVRAVVYIQVVNPPLAVTKVVDYRSAAGHLVQSSLRSTLGQVSLADLLTDRDKVNALLARVINEELEPWGIQTTAVEIKDVLLPESMLRALGREAEAEREIKAKLVAAEGELATARALTDAAGALATTPNALQLRYLQTLTEIGNERSTVVVFPVPIDIVQPILEMQGRLRKQPGSAADHGDGAASAVEPGDGAASAPAGRARADESLPGPYESERERSQAAEASEEAVERPHWSDAEARWRSRRPAPAIEYEAPPPPPPPPLR
jgi:regulator of protease activity HflC (stomatin/prohibitin superfamily)